MSREKRWILAIAVALVALGVVVMLPSGKDESPRLWSEDWTALEFEGRDGPVRMEKVAGWYSDAFLVGSPGGIMRLASPSVKSFFLDLQRPVVKGEYRITEQEAAEMFAEPRCVTMLRGSIRRELCGGRVAAGQAFARLKEDPLRVYLLPDYIFSRLKNDPALWIEKRLVVLPSGSAADRVHVTIRGESIDLVRKKEKVEQGEKIHWYAGEREVPLNLANNLLSALYGLQREQMVEDRPASQDVSGEVRIDTVTESPSIEGVFRGMFGRGSVRLRLYGPRSVDGAAMYALTGEADGSADLVSEARVERVLAAMKAVAAPPAAAAPPAELELPGQLKTPAR